MVTPIEKCRNKVYSIYTNDEEFDIYRDRMFNFIETGRYQSLQETYIWFLKRRRKR